MQIASGREHKELSVDVFAIKKQSKFCKRNSVIALINGKHW